MNIEYRIHLAIWGLSPSEPFCPSLLFPYTTLDSHGISGFLSTPILIGIMEKVSDFVG